MNTRVLKLPSDTSEVASETSSTLKAFGVLEILVRTRRAVTLSELMQATELPKPTLHRTLSLFEEAGFLAREPGGRGYVEIAESCNLAVLQKGALIYLDRIEAPWPLRLHLPEGGVALPLHCCASGKLLLAYLPPAERQRLLELMPLQRFTERTITERTVLESELDRIASAGYAVDNEEYVLGVACVAVPVRNGHDEVIAAIAVQAATARLPLMRAIEFVPRLRSAAAQIGSTFG
jgi:DNA-binding IclR family transcriptional regulator